MTNFISPSEFITEENKLLIDCIFKPNAPAIDCVKFFIILLDDCGFPLVFDDIENKINSCCNSVFISPEKEEMISFLQNGLLDKNRIEKNRQYFNLLKKLPISYTREKFSTNSIYGPYEQDYSQLISGLSRFYSENKPQLIKGDFSFSYTDFLYKNSAQTKEAVGFVANQEELSDMKIRRYVSGRNIEIINSEESNIIFDRFDLAFIYERDEYNCHFKTNITELGIPENASEELLQAAILVNSLKESGTGFYITHKSTAFKKDSLPFREFLIKNHYIKAIIDYNQKYSYSEGQYIVYVIGRNCNKIKVIDYSFDYKQIDQYLVISNPSAVIDLLSSENKNSRTIDYSSIDDSYNLLPSYILYKSNYICTTYPLEDLFEIRRGSIKPLPPTESTEEKIKFLSQADLDSVFIDKEILKFTLYNEKLEKYVLPQGVNLIISRAGPIFKLSLIKIENGEKIIVGPNLFYFSIDNDSYFKIYYLFSFLSSERGQMALKGISTGNAVPMLNIESLRSMNIPFEKAFEIGERCEQNISKVEKAKKKLQETISDLHSIESFFDTLCN